MQTLSNQQMESKIPAQAQTHERRKKKKKRKTLFGGCLIAHSLKNSLVHLHTACTETACIAEARQALPIALVKPAFHAEKMADKIK